MTNAIKRRREAAGLTQQQLCDRIQLAITQLSRLENGRSLPQRRTLIALAEALSVDVDTLRSEITERGATCPECGGWIKPEAAWCPSCAEPIR